MHHDAISHACVSLRDACPFRPCYAVGYELGHHVRAVVGHFSGLAQFYSLFAALVLAVRTSHGERTDGTLAFSAALPVPIRRMGTVRIVSAVATLAIPIVIAAGILSIALYSGLVEQVEPRHLDTHMPLPQRATAALFTSLEQLGSVTAIAALGGVELLLVLNLLGCYLRSQAQIGLMGAVVALGSIIAAGVFWALDRYSRQRAALRGTLRASRFQAAWLSACLQCTFGLDFPARAPLMPIGQTTSANIPLVRAPNGITSSPKKSGDFVCSSAGTEGRQAPPGTERYVWTPGRIIYFSVIRMVYMIQLTVAVMGPTSFGPRCVR